MTFKLIYDCGNIQVLLYNFFEDSTVEVSQWRVILNALAEKKHLRCPTFDDTRHSGVCREVCSYLLYEFSKLIVI